MRVFGRNFASFAVLALIAIPITAIAQAPPLNFAKPRPYNWVGEDWVVSVAVADLNGDGHLDLVAALSGKIAVLQGKGDATFRRVVKYSPGGSYPSSVAIADVNGDGKPDILVLDSFGALGVLLGNGDGSFQPAVTYSAGYGYGLAVGDLNGDGHPDLAVAGGTCDYWWEEGWYSCVTVLYNDGYGTFNGAFEYDDGGYGGSLAVAIVDGSLIVTNACLDHWCDWILGTVCIDRRCYRTGGEGPVALATGDLNHDGYLDIVVANTGDDSWGGVSVLLGNSRGTFLHLLYGRPTNPWDVAVGDMNGDGKPDIVVDGTGVLLGKGNGSFQPVVNFGWVGENFVLGDVNEDGKLDVIGTEGIILNTSGFLTTTQITSSLNPSFVNQSVTFTATVTSMHGLIPDGELVKFYSGAKLLASVPLSGGTATYTTSTLTAETHIMKAKYAGDTTYAPSAGHIKQLVQ